MELFAADGHDAGGCERVTGKSGMRPALRRLDRYDAEGHRITMHGFRTTFCTWAQECVPGSWEAAEVALAHQDSDKTRKAYARSALDEPRAKLMQQWADYVLPRSNGSGDG